VFDLRDNERLIEWKKFRNSIEHSQSPLQDVADFWSMAPFVNRYLDPSDTKSWPDPWHLVLDGKFDNLAICLGMLYTLQLTQRFMHGKYEIHMSVTPEIKEPLFYLSVDRSFILNYTYKQVVEYDHRLLQDTTPVFSTAKEK
jgi:hypothetical protein